MPLRMRLIALVGLTLLASLAGGSVLIAWHAAGSVRTELRAALDVGTNTIRNGLDDIAAADDRSAGPRQLIATFNGNRHVRATLLDAAGQPIATSRLLAPKQPAASWFVHLVGGPRRVISIPVPQLGEQATIVLRSDPTNEASEVWDESRDAVLILGAFALLSAWLAHVAVGRALRPLENLSTAFDRISDGNYLGRVPEQGPPELARLAKGFNHMTERLATIAAQNRRLHERLLTLQAEERADLARDLHDEVGPLLFAVDMTAATIERLANDDRADDIPAHVRSIHEAVGRMQRHVRTILRRLRPLRSTGLEPAIDRLVGFWQSRRSEIDFNVSVSIEEDRIGDDMKETIYRVIQEGVSNAIRHGEPAHIEIAVTHAMDDIHVEVTDDGVGIAADGIADGHSRFGLIGMRERVMAMAGSLSIRHGRDGKGLTVTACLPSHDREAIE